MSELPVQNHRDHEYSSFDDDTKQMEEILFEDIPMQNNKKNLHQIVPIINDIGSIQIMTTPSKKPPETFIKMPQSRAGAISPVTSSDIIDRSTSPQRYTNRTKFIPEYGEDDDMERYENSQSYTYNPSPMLMSPSQIVPIIQDITTTEVMASPKSKPFTPIKLAKNKNRGEVLTPEKAIEFMIKEKQSMDSEYASLRKQNYELKSELEKRANSPIRSVLPTQEIKQETPSSKVTVEHLYFKSSQEDIDRENKWKAETERVRLENESLKKQLKENEEKMRQHYENLLLKIALDGSPTLSRASSLASPDDEDDLSEYSSPSPHDAVRTLSKSHSSRSIPLRKSSKNYSGLLDDYYPLQRNMEIPVKRRSSTDVDGLVDVRRFLWDGLLLWKVPCNSNGFPERRVVKVRREVRPGENARRIRVLNDEGTYEIPTDASKQLFIAYPLTILWHSTKSGDSDNLRELILNRDAHIIPGHGTPAFWRLVNNGLGVPSPECCFSIVSHLRTLDFVADSEEQARYCMDGLESILAAFSGKSSNILRKQKFSFRGQEVESNYVPTHSVQSHAKQDIRMKEIDSLKKQMFVATMSGDYDQLQDILDVGISVNLMEPTRSDTPLMIACRAGNADIIKLCLHYGAKNDPHPDFGHTALHAAVLSGQLGAAAILLTAAAESDADTIIVNLSDPSGQTPLHVAAEKGLLSLMQLLLSHGAEIDKKDGSGRTAIHICASLGHKKCLAVLLENSGDSLLEEVDHYGNTAVHCSAENGHLACTRLLLETAADAQSRNDSGKTPYMLANAKGHFQVAQLVLQYQKPFNASYASPASATTTPGAGPGTGSNYQKFTPPPSSQKQQQQVQEQKEQQPFKYFMQPMRAANDETLPRPHTSPRPTSSDLTSKNFLRNSSNSPLSADAYGDADVPVPAGIRSTSYPSFENSSPTSTTDSTYDRNRAKSHGTYKNGFFPEYEEKESDEAVRYNDKEQSNVVYPTEQQQQVDEEQDEQQLWASETPDAVYEGDVCPPLESFLLEGVDWSVYATEEGHVYYLNVDSHSQWGDPRVYGVYYEQEYDTTKENSMKSPTKAPLSTQASPTCYDNPDKVQMRRLSNDDFDWNSIEESVPNLAGISIQDNHATYKTPRKDLFERFKEEIQEEKVEKDVLPKSLNSNLNNYIKSMESGASLRDIRITMEGEGAKRDDIVKMLTLLDEIELRNALEDSFSDTPISTLELATTSVIPEDILAVNVWRMEKFAQQNSQVKTSDSGDVSSPRRKLIMYNISIGLSQIKALGPIQRVLESLCGLELSRGCSISSDQLEVLIQVLPFSSSDLEHSLSVPLTGHLAEDFLEVAGKFYPELPYRLYACIVCSRFNTQYSEIKSKCKLFIDGCNQILSSDRVYNLLTTLLDGDLSTVSANMVTTKNEVLQSTSTAELRDIIEDLLLMDACIRTTSADILHQIDNICKSVVFLESEQNKSMNGSLQKNDRIAEKINTKYSNNLVKYLDSYTEKSSDLMLQRKLIQKKIDSIGSYFGGDDSSRDITAVVFQSLHHLSLSISNVMLDRK